MNRLRARWLTRPALPALPVLLVVLIAAVALTAPATSALAAPAGHLHLEDFTWTELRARIDAGATTVLIPIGGTEQNGPHISLGKHNQRVRLLAEKIAKALGNAVVAPVLAYVPEGNITPPTQHMRYAGTISVPEAAFEAMLEAAARSLRQHGFRDVVLLGDHGGYRSSLDRVAARLNNAPGPRSTGRADGRSDGRSDGRADGRVLALGEYYRAASRGYIETLKARGFSAAEIGSHAGLADTSLSLAIHPAGVRSEVIAAGRSAVDVNGVVGDPRRASAELGQIGVEQIVAASVAAIQTRLAR